MEIRSKNCCWKRIRHYFLKISPLGGSNCWFWQKHENRYNSEATKSIALKLGQKLPKNIFFMWYKSQGDYIHFRKNFKLYNKNQSLKIAIFEFPGISRDQNENLTTDSDSSENFHIFQNSLFFDFSMDIFQ